MTQYLKKNRKQDEKKMISTRIRLHVFEAFQKASYDADKNGYTLTLSSVIEEALENAISEYTEASGKDFLKIEKDKLENKWEKLQMQNDQLKAQLGNVENRLYHEGGGYNRDMFFNTIGDVYKAVINSVNALSPGAKFKLPSVKKLCSGFSKGEFIIHPDVYMNDKCGSIISLLEWKDSDIDKPSLDELENEADMQLWEIMGYSRDPEIRKKQSEDNIKELKKILE